MKVCFAAFLGVAFGGCQNHAGVDYNGGDISLPFAIGSWESCCQWCCGGAGGQLPLSDAYVFSKDVRCWCKILAKTNPIASGDFSSGKCGSAVADTNATVV